MPTLDAVKPALIPLTAALFALTCATHATAIDPAAPYAGRAPGATHVLDHQALLGSVDDPDWFEHNIPFLDVPDAQIQQVYYYRWQTYKEHLVYTGPIYGWLSSEFLQPASYGAPYGGIDAAAGHQITEGRWLRDQRYVRDDIDYWLTGPGRFAKPQFDGVNVDTSDWAHEYSFWAASSVWQTYLANGDKTFVTALLPDLVHQYRGWDNHFDPGLGLYWQVPVWDATEFTPSSYESPDPYHGGAGFRPTINAYQYGDARAIADIARLYGDPAVAKEYDGRATALRADMQAHLWDPKRGFFYPMSRDGNPSHALLDTRELEGFVPWMFDMPAASDVVAFAQLLDPEGFYSTYGPTTAERRSRWFMYQAAGCCHWDGPSWPYETSQVLTGVANLLDDYPAQKVITPANYVDLLDRYAATQYRNGQPYVAEAHDPDRDTWIYDAHDHSEDYNHSTYVDNVISGLIGVRGQPGDTVVVKPLAPVTWPYFALENVPYHGHNLSVFWDRTGTRYHIGAGLTVFVDGIRSRHRPAPGPLTVDVGRPITQSNAGGVVDAAANGQRFDYGPKPFASFTSPYDNVWNAVDGIVYREGIPENSRWTSYSSTNASDYYGIDFQHPVTVDDIRLYFYDDGGGVRVPSTYDLEYWNGKGWASVPGQTRSPATAAANAMTRITFPAITASKLRVVAPNAGKGVGWGLSEFEAMSRPIFEIVNVNWGKPLSLFGTSRWELVDAGAGWFKLTDPLTHRVLGAGGSVVGWSKSASSPGEFWRFVDTGSGRFKIMDRAGDYLAAEGRFGFPIAQAASRQPDELWNIKVTGGR